MCRYACRGARVRTNYRITCSFIGATTFNAVVNRGAQGFAWSLACSAAGAFLWAMFRGLHCGSEALYRLTFRLQTHLANGETTRVLLVSRYVTDLRESEERVLLAAHALEGMTEAIVITAADGNPGLAPGLRG